MPLPDQRHRPVPDRCQIQSLTLADLPGIQALQAACFEKHWSETQLTAYLSNKLGCCFGLWQGGHLAGYALFTCVLDEAELQQIAIAPASQRMGLAGCLLTAAQQQLASRGIHRVLLEVRASNAAALGLYQRLGYQHDGVRKGYYPGPEGREDARLMSCDITDSAITD